MEGGFVVFGVGGFGHFCFVGRRGRRGVADLWWVRARGQAR